MSNIDPDSKPVRGSPRPGRARAAKSADEHDGTFSKEFTRRDYLSYAAFVPIVLATLGISYDLGYFLRIGINLFTLFSLSEHLLFAIQGALITLPIFIYIALTLPFGLTMGHLTVNKNKIVKPERKDGK